MSVVILCYRKYMFQPFPQLLARVPWSYLDKGTCDPDLLKCLCVMWQSSEKLLKDNWQMLTGPSFLFLYPSSFLEFDCAGWPIFQSMQFRVLQGGLNRGILHPEDSVIRVAFLGLKVFPLAFCMRRKSTVFAYITSFCWLSVMCTLTAHRQL